MRIYLADLAHTGKGRSPNTVPLAAGYLAAYLSARRPDAEIAVFHDTEHLLDTVQTHPPDLLGLSLHLWSERLSGFVARRVKDLSQETVVAVGGPSVDYRSEELALLLKTAPAFDVCIAGEGELGLASLVERLEGRASIPEREAIDGCAYLDEDR